MVVKRGKTTLFVLFFFVFFLPFCFVGPALHRRENFLTFWRWHDPECIGKYGACTGKLMFSLNSAHVTLFIEHLVTIYMTGFRQLLPFVVFFFFVLHIALKNL